MSGHVPSIALRQWLMCELQLKHCTGLRDENPDVTC